MLFVYRTPEETFAITGYAKTLHEGVESIYLYSYSTESPATFIQGDPISLNIIYNFLGTVELGTVITSDLLQKVVETTLHKERTEQLRELCKSQRRETPLSKAHTYPNQKHYSMNHEPNNDLLDEIREAVRFIL